MTIIPSAKRILMYNVCNDEIVTYSQILNLTEERKVDQLKLTEKRFECIRDIDLDNSSNFCFIYIHVNGTLEKEVNVTKPKYPFHANFK